MTYKNEKIDLLRKWEPRCETFAGEAIDSGYKLKQPPFPKRGDIYWVELGENIGSESNQFHPCVIASRDGFNRNSGMVTVIPGTSAHIDPHKHPDADSYSLHAGEFFVIPSHSSNLKKRTLFQVQQIKTLSRNRLIAKIGTLSNSELSLLKSRIKKHLDL
ncbi:type II toxin-antitoxin system PemK/MazF family toxin [Lacticaseibacillus paracasei]|uniref:type II toxin-antitoxin system PemK/MazF family toxin n=1 Tax=Lacticaseibacillus paracasei TaxID=1597 RepID=UPI0022EC8DCD|nr:type II toxin-antitoxin system PemK/MazF family toxin [Lacticaseibacillus paracasei]WBS99987.1 type II toxin-antitoxin system PemK/MazF family toxin [Lacticaseibacillus paracasei]